MGDEPVDAELTFLGRPLPTWVDRRIVAIQPEHPRPFDEEEWRDAIVVVERGEVVLECTRGGFTTFRQGDMLWLVGVPLRWIHNRGDEPAILVAMSRRPADKRTDPQQDQQHEWSSTMTNAEPITELDPGFSSDGATPTPWSDGQKELETAEIFWISTVRPDGRPHVTPLMGIMIDGSLLFCTGATERKAMNIEQNPHCVMTTGRNAMNDGLDVVVEGDAVRVTDDATLQRAAELYSSKYGWAGQGRDGALHFDDGVSALLFQVNATKAFGFRKGDPYSQTRWTF